jgi:hypothetical protein
MFLEEFGSGSGSTCWQRLGDRQDASVWRRLLRVSLDRLDEADPINSSRASLHMFKSVREDLQHRRVATYGRDG